MKRAVLYLALALCVSPALAGSETESPRDMVLLTVGGLVGKTNRGPVDAKPNVLLAEHKAAFRAPLNSTVRCSLRFPKGRSQRNRTHSRSPLVFPGPCCASCSAISKRRSSRSRSRRSTALPAGLRRRISTGRIGSTARNLLRAGFEGPIWLVKSGAQKVDSHDPKHGDWVWNVFYINIGE